MGFKSSNNKQNQLKVLKYSVYGKSIIIQDIKILNAIRSKISNIDGLLGYTKVSLGNTDYISIHNVTKRFDSCFISKITKKIGLIEYFVLDSERCWVVAKQIIEIYNPHFTDSIPELKSKSTICYNTENYFVLNNFFYIYKNINGFNKY